MDGYYFPSAQDRAEWLSFPTMNRKSRRNEKVANGALERRIKEVMHGRETQAERTRVLAGKGNAGKAPDIVVTAKGRSPVIIEAEYSPAINVEQEARDRLGYNIEDQIHRIEAVIALRYPEDFEFVKDIVKAFEDPQLKLQYCAVYPKGKRFPTTGWLTGSVCDLADLIHLVDVPETAFQKCAENLETSINEAVTMFPPLKKLNEGPVHEIFKRLGLTEDSKVKELNWEERRKAKRIQVGRIAGAIIANALLFQERIAAAYPDQDIPPIHQLFGQPGKTAQRAALQAWKKILAINYWPIFDAAIQIIDVLTAFPAGEVLRILAKAAERIHEDGLLYENDLTGHVFQKLIIDRKYLAAFYTLPTSAALLANLAVAKMKDIDWSDKDAIGKLKIADFACGTGALLSAVYDQIANRYERAGDKRNPADLHQALMEKVFHGFDVVHYATCLTASILSGKQPGIAYQDTHFGTMPYGRQSDKTVKLGSLEFLDKSEQQVLFHTGDPAKQIHSKRKKRRHIEVLNNLNLVIMNPPFTRTGNKVMGKEKRKTESNRAPFSAFGASDADQKEMAERMTKLTKGTCYGDGGGIASAFAAIADKKLKPGGVLALVVPLAVANGSSWQKLRTLLAKNYEDIEVISLAAPKSYDVAFSAHTAMADCLVIARKKSPTISDHADKPTRFISLHRRPDKLAAAGETARELMAKPTKRALEDGPFGGTDVNCGEEKMGEAITANLPKTDPHWNAVRIHDFELVQTAYQLTQHSKLWMPRKSEDKPLKITAFSNIGEIRLSHQAFVGPSAAPPFYKTKSTPKPNDNDGYPALWNHNCEQEHYLVCQPDRKLKATKGQEARANELWNRFAGRAHLTQDHTLTSQPLTVAFTKRKCIGGTAWPNVNFPKKDWDYAFSIWMNSTLGLILFWWHGNRTQPGRARITVTTAKTLPVLDFRALSEEQIAQAKEIFDDFKRRSFRPAYRADVDETRAELDKAVLCEWLGFDERIWKAVQQLAFKWCAEPSVHGGKKKEQS